MSDQSWRASAVCAQTDPALFFPTKGDDVRRRVTIICGSCPVRDACLTDTLDQERGLAHSSRDGWYAGTSPRDRARLDPTAPNPGRPAHERLSRSPAQIAATLARQARSRALYDAGTAIVAIAVELGVSTRTIDRDLKATSTSQEAAA